MHKLNRSSVTAPSCLAGYDYRTQAWDDIGAACKRQVRDALLQVQGIPGVTTKNASEFGLRCAYCEGAIRHGGHIEHFRRKNCNRSDGYPELTFDWDNLFLACGSQGHCGHYKDRRLAPPYDPDLIIKPDEHDPDHYLYFHSSGEVRPRNGLSQADELRARETIRVFGLDSRALAGERARAVSKYRNMKSQDFEELASWDEADRQEYLRAEIEETHWEPYATTIKHFLQGAA